MRNLRTHHDDVPDLDRFGFRPLLNPSNVPSFEPQTHRHAPPPRSKSSSVNRAGTRPGAHQDKSEFTRESLHIHNDLRRRHGVEPLRLNDDLSKLAQQWGNDEHRIRLASLLSHDTSPSKSSGFNRNISSQQDQVQEHQCGRKSSLPIMAHDR